MPKCDCCQREVDKVRSSVWHGQAMICTECFIQWYDCDSGDIDVTDPVALGNHVRGKHGLPPIDAHQN